MRNCKIYYFCLLLALLSCEKDEQYVASKASFVSFIANGQTLPTAIKNSKHLVKFEVDHDVDVSQLVPEFEVPDGCSVYVNGVLQVSGSSVVDFSQSVTYELKDSENRSIKWEASAIPLSCKILVDASHDGGGWWFPQSPLTGFNQNEWHQGQAFANFLREKGFVVDELGRGVELTEEMFFGYYIVIRASGFFHYTDKELEVYAKLIDRGMNLVFFTDHKKHDPVDELGDYLGLKFEGVSYGAITKFKSHIITQNISSIEYIAGSVLTNSSTNPNIEILGWLGETDYADFNFNGVKDEGEPTAPPVMGILNYPNSHIFFIGDTNGLEVRPQPFIDNLIEWMGMCFL
ncbi:MAG: hypothetical protein AB9846_03385 [Tenuifilaceae bacterium]